MSDLTNLLLAALPTVELESDIADGVKIVAGTPIDIAAAITGRPTPTMRWTRNNIPIVPDQQLVVDSTGSGSVLHLLQV